MTINTKDFNQILKPLIEIVTKTIIDDIECEMNNYDKDEM